MIERGQTSHQNKGKEDAVDELSLADYLGIREEYRDLPAMRQWLQVYGSLNGVLESLPPVQTDPQASSEQLSPQLAARYDAVRELVFAAFEVLQDGVPLYGSQHPWSVSVDGLVGNLQRAVSRYPIEVRQQKVMPSEGPSSQS
jgi:hypothetical protein